MIYPALSLLRGHPYPALVPLVDQRLRLYPVQFYLVVVSGMSLHLSGQTIGFLRMCSDFDFSFFFLMLRVCCYMYSTQFYFHNAALLIDSIDSVCLDRSLETA